MERYVRNDEIVFTGKDAIEYKNVCDGKYRNDERRETFQKYMSEHMQSMQDMQTGATYITCDFIDLGTLLDVRV